MASRTPSPSVRSASPSPTDHATTEELSLAEKAKEGLITTACNSQDFAALIDLSTSTHGLVSDSLRRIAWPLLLGCADASVEKTPWQALPAHKDEGQVALDVNRAFVYYPPYGQCGHSMLMFPSHDSDRVQLQRKILIVENMNSPMSSSMYYAGTQLWHTSRVITILYRSSTLSLVLKMPLRQLPASVSFE